MRQELILNSGCIIYLSRIVQEILRGTWAAAVQDTTQGRAQGKVRGEGVLASFSTLFLVFNQEYKYLSLSFGGLVTQFPPRSLLLLTRYIYI
jgi:hypothetical protein